MVNGKTVKLISLLASLAGTAATLVTSWTEEKKMEAKIVEKSSEVVEQILKEKGLI